MIEKIRIQGFKAAEDLPLRLSNLTVLAGLNGSGKSTVLQSLSALRQSFVNGEISEFRLRGALVQLGTFQDVHTDGVDSDSIEIHLLENGEEFSWRMVGDNDDSRLEIVDSKCNCAPSFAKTGNFQLLQADRIVPRTMYSTVNENGEEFGLLGANGEYVADFLLSESAEQFSVSDNRVFMEEGLGLTTELLQKVAPTKQLKDQVSGWLQQLSPGVRVDVSKLIGTDHVSLHYGYVGRKGISESDRRIRPINVGFGLTYSLPLVVACLVARPGSLLLLENPEAHLHPQGQAALGQLMVKAAKDGVQIVVETHSDHVLNGIRVAAKKGYISPEEVAIHYFKRQIETGFISTESPTLLENGRLSNWPDGFFDQWDKAVESLLGD